MSACTHRRRATSSISILDPSGSEATPIVVLAESPKMGGLETNDRRAVGLNPTTMDLDRIFPLDDEMDELADLARLDPPLPTIRERAGGTAAGIVAAAMLGIGEILEPQRKTADVEIVGEAPLDEPIVDLDLTFGGLPPIDRLS